MHDEYSFRSLCHSGSRKTWEKLSIWLSFLPSLPHRPRYFHNLQNLSLAYCRKFTDKGLQYLNLGNGCHKLIYLDLSGCTQVCLPVSVFSVLQQARTSSREPAASSPHVALMLCVEHRTLCWGFKLHGHSCFNFLQDCYYRRLASVHRRVTSTNRQSSLDDETDHFWEQFEGRVQISKTL